MNDTITLQLEPKQLDYLANVLGQRPYAEVAQLLAAIAQQVQQQQLARMAPEAATGASNGSGATLASPGH